MDLSSTSFSGTIPSELQELSQLEALFLGDCNFTGNIPSELGRLSKLFFLELDTNYLTGPMPTELGSLSSMLTLKMNLNSLTGNIPTEYANMQLMEYLSLQSNFLTGEMPAEVCELTDTLVAYADCSEVSCLCCVDCRDACCSYDNKNCDPNNDEYCGADESQCLECNGVWLSSGPLTQCIAKYEACLNSDQDCCGSASCVGDEFYKQCEESLFY